jgi:predicted ester cyclase
MTPEDHKALYRRWFEQVVSRGDMRQADELLDPSYRLHFPGIPQPLDREGHKGLVRMFRSAFPDWTETVDDMIAEGDKVVIRVTGRGSHEGEFQGLQATGAQVTATGVGIARVQDGRIVEAWAAYDALGLMQQLGASPVALTGSSQ